VPEKALSRHILGRLMDRNGSGRMVIIRSNSWRSAMDTASIYNAFGVREGTCFLPDGIVLCWRSLREVFIGTFSPGFLVYMCYLPEMLLVACCRDSFRFVLVTGSSLIGLRGPGMYCISYFHCSVCIIIHIPFNVSHVYLT
jgi:hypothetical protein